MPFRPLPRDMRLDEQRVSNDGPKPAECRDEAELADLLAQSQVQIRSV